MKNILFTFSLVFIAFLASAQDKHFTQFYAAPLALNPALSGAFDGKYRFSVIYRDQWRRVLDAPYKTFAAGLDLRFPLETSGKRTKDAAGIGLLFFNDNVPGIDFSTTQIALSGSFHKSLSSENNQFLSGGVQFGISQRNVNLNNLVFNDQFNGTTGYSDPTNEELPENNFAFPDLSVGINYSYAPARGIAFFVGGSMHHVLEPQVSFYYNKDEPEQGGNNRLLRRYSAQVSFRIPISEQVQLLPRAVGTLQGPHLEINAGTNVRFQLGEDSPAALHVGGWLRPVTNGENTFDIDAVVLMAGIELNNVLLGLSYDATLNDLATTRQGQGAFEISIAYLGNYENETILCPKF